MDLGWLKELSLSLCILQFLISHIWEILVPAGVVMWDSKQGHNTAVSVAITKLAI